MGNSRSINKGNDSVRGAVVISTSYTALAIVRSLGRHSIPVWVFDNGRSPTAHSRYVKKIFFLDMENESRLIEDLANIATEYSLKDWALYPDGDKSAALIAKYYQQLGAHYKLTTPPWEILKWAVDKRLTYQMADEVGVDYPRAFYPQTRADVEAIDGPFPVIIKPIHHQGHDAVSTGRAWQAWESKDLLTLYDELTKVADPGVIMIQEMIMAGPGTQFSYGALCKNGDVIADIFAERKRLTPPNFGVSAFVQSMDIPELDAPAKRWLKQINYTGIVELEFMLDKRDGLYKILDVNTRAWGWIDMAAYAGVDFPYLLWKLVFEQEIKPSHARAGIRWSRTIYDFASSAQSIWAGRLSVFEFIFSLIGAKHEMYVFDDPKPAMMELFHLFQRAFRKLRKIINGNSN